MKNSNFLTKLIIAFFVGIVVYYGLSSVNFENFNKDLLVNKYFLSGVAFIIALLIVLIDFNGLNIKNSRYKDKLFKSLIHNSDTIYIIMKKGTVLYLSDNVGEVLGFKVDQSFSQEKIVSDILNIPVLKDEIKKWDKKSEYVSQMITYHNPLYNHKAWLKVKIYQYNENNEAYEVIQISNVDKEHDRQHLLISQTNDIKIRKQQLDQITRDSYDLEMIIDVYDNAFNLKYYKTDMKYFGNERSGNLTEEINNIINTYVNPNDQKAVRKVANMDHIKFLIENKVFDPIVVRYRIGDDIKDSVWLESTIFFVTAEDNVNLSVLTKNVTESAANIREQNIMLQNAVNEAKESLEAKDELVSTISHDIRIPMTTINGLSNSLLDKSVDLDIHDDIKNIYDASCDVIAIIDEMLNISKLNKTTFKEQKTQYYLSDLINKINAYAQKLIGAKDINFVANVDNNLPVVLYGDNKHILKIVKEIINNSIKFTDEGEVKLDVKAEKQQNSVDLKFIIYDSGKGMSSEQLKTLFEDNKSSGLGKIKKLIELLNGTIEFESKEGKYTQVVLVFNQLIVEDNKIRQMMKKEELSYSGFENKKVLIVDDNKLNLKVTSRMLEPYNFSVVDKVESGNECLDKINAGYDLILLDQMMPGMDGVTTLKHIRETNIDIPVVALTADAMVGQKEYYLKLGFNDYLSKPIDKIELNKVINKLLNK